MKAKLISTLLEDTVDINTIEEMSSIAETESRLFTQYFDPALAAVLRPHQLEAVKFLLPRLLGEEISQPIELDENYLPPQQSRDSGIPLTGAVLADDMGTGKTLTALAVLWCLCRHGKGKGVIICPSSLVDNWRAEVKKWFPKNLDRSALYINGSNRSSGVKGTDSIVDLFASSHPSMRPLLVLSYDMFRIYSDVLNEITTFNTVICDEGHKIKNALGTKTTLALGNCCAMQRLVLTGTPIQNNLNELFAVVQFAAPGYLGDLKEFQTRYAVPIMKNPTSNAAKQAKNQLRLALRRILLRRDRDAILKSVLPPRVVTGVVCRLSDAQREAYLAECAVLTNERALENSSNLVDEETALPLTKKARTLEGSGPRGHETLMVLSKLLMLRQVCSVPPPIGTAPEGANVDSYLRMTVKLRVRR